MFCRIRCFGKPPEIRGSSHQAEVKRRAALVIDQSQLCSDRPRMTAADAHPAEEGEEKKKSKSDWTEADGYCLAVTHPEQRDKPTTNVCGNGA